LLNNIEDVSPTLPLLIVMSSDIPCNELNLDITNLFEINQVFEVPTEYENQKLENFFLQAIDEINVPLPKLINRVYKSLPLAPIPEEPIQVVRMRLKHREKVLRILRDKIRQILDEIKRSRKFLNFFKPMSQKYHNYNKKIEKPIDLSIIRKRNDSKYYTNLDLLMQDINLLHENTVQYFGDNDETGNISKSTELKDIVLGNIDEIDDSFLEEIRMMGKTDSISLKRRSSIRFSETTVQNNENINENINETNQLTQPTQQMDMEIIDTNEEKEKEKEKIISKISKRKRDSSNDDSDDETPTKKRRTNNSDQEQTKILTSENIKNIKSKIREYISSRKDQNLEDYYKIYCKLHNLLKNYDDKKISEVFVK